MTNFGSVPNISFTGTKKLVSIPMVTYGATTITVGKIVIVRKKANGEVETISVPLTSIQPKSVGTGTPMPNIDFPPV
ncbi:hypothetical protein D3C85_1848500 [compost metagenome]